MAAPAKNRPRTLYELPPRYDVGEELAAGGMGTVYRGFDRLAKRPIAYKRLKISNEASRSRMAALFQCEYDRLAHLTHPNIVEVYDFGVDAFGPYYTMELLSGDDLTDLAPLPVKEACRVLRDVASALALLHARRLIHRDVGPNNVRLTSDGRAKLIDFGGMTEFGVPNEIIGTAAFVPPECLTGAELDGRTDLYALGALAYWTLTRRTHIRARHIDELEDCWSIPVVPPSHYTPDVPPALDELVLSLLQHDRVARPSSAADVIERLTRIAALNPEEDERRVAFSYLQHAPLRGRADVTSQFSELLGLAMSGRGQLALVESQQGLGRTSMLDHIAIQAQLGAATVLRAQGNLHNTPFSAAHHLVELGMGILPDAAARSGSSSAHLSQRSSTLKSMTQVGARSTIDMSEHQMRVASHLQSTLLQLSLRSPLVLLIDDAHAIDAESLALFASMQEDIRRYPILLVLSTHAGQPTQQPQAYARLSATATRCKLTPLTAEHTVELVSTMFGGVRNSSHLAVWLHEQTGGNPARSMDLARLLLAQGMIRYAGGTFTLPFEFAGIATLEKHGVALLASLSGLTEQAGDLAYLLGVHPGALTVSELVSASGLDARDVLLALAELTQRDAAVASGESFSCASEALRAALCSSRTPEQAREAHLALARTFGQYEQNTIAYRLATARHLLSAGGEEAFEGACLLARTGDEHKFALAMAPANLPLLERALEVFKERGISEVRCVGLLVPRSLTGFYGELEPQRLYLDRTMTVLWILCGLTRAKRLTRWVGPKLGLTLGIIGALLAFAFRKRPYDTRKFAEYFEVLGGIIASASAATACMWDAPETTRLVHWLDPLEHASKRSVLYLMQQFCVTNADLISGKFGVAAKRYAGLFEEFNKPVAGINEDAAEQFRAGCIHGEAQATVTDCAPRALVLAEQLAKRSTFFRPHAEGILMTYYAYRGEAQKAAVHRERAEALALLGGTAWSATSVLILRSVHACVLTGDVVGFVQVIADLEQLAKQAPNIAVFHRLAQAHLEQMRGFPERALPVYEQLLGQESALRFPTYPLDRALHVRALVALGRCEEARTLGLKLLDEITASGRDGDNYFVAALEELAFAEAGLGNFERANEVLQGCMERAGRYENPAALGGVHHAFAFVAVLAGDKPGYEQHAAAMSTYFRATENPCLIQHSELLHAHAVRNGIAHAVGGITRGEDELDGATAIESVVESDTHGAIRQGKTA